MALAQPYDAVIIGGGLAGTTVAAELAQIAPAGFRVLLIAGSEPGPGTAYAPFSTRLFMNGTAKSMSAVPSDERDLVRWLSTQPDEALIPRRVFGRYLSERFRKALAQRPEFDVARSQAVDASAGADDFTVLDERGNAYRAPCVVLALGNFKPDDGFLPSALREHARFAGDPWRWNPSESDVRGEDALVVGSGLTAMDAIALLDERGFGGKVHVVSRHGLVPCIENPFARALDPKTLALDPTTPATLVRTLRRAAEKHVEGGGDWRDVIEGIRSISPAIWASWNSSERRRFLRHVQSYWAIHRYRVPPETAAVYSRLERKGRLVRHRGRIAAASPEAGDRIGVEIAGPAERHRIVVDLAINCTGPSGDYARIAHPLVRNLLSRGLARPDELHLGLDARGQCVVDREGVPNDRLFALGPPLRGVWYETTAVPETCRQAARIARSIVAECARASALEAAS